MIIYSKNGLIFLNYLGLTSSTWIKTFSAVILDDNGIEKDVVYHLVRLPDKTDAWYDMYMSKVDKHDSLLLTKMYNKL